MPIPGLTNVFPTVRPGQEMVIYIQVTGPFDFVVPYDWTSDKNSIECLGAGASGGVCTGGYAMGTGGGGGAYSKALNIDLSPGQSCHGSVGKGGDSVSVDGAGNVTKSQDGVNGGNTWFNNSTFGGPCSAQGGLGGKSGAQVGAITGGIGGSDGAGTGSVKFPGGNGGGFTAQAFNTGSGGGGAGGPNGAGKPGDSGAAMNAGQALPGGAGDNGTGGIGGAAAAGAGPNGAPGGNGVQFDPTHGCGGGGGGGTTNVGTVGNTVKGGAAGNFGGGGGGAGGNWGQIATSGKGGDGLVIIRYGP